MGKVINYFTPGNVMKRDEARIYGGAMIATIFIRLAFDHHYNYLSFIVGMRARVACCSLVYRKVRCIEPRHTKKKKKFEKKKCFIYKLNTSF